MRVENLNRQTGYWVSIVLTLSILVMSSEVGTADSGRTKQEKNSAQRLWEQAISAKGGREKLLGFQSLYVARNMGRDQLRQLFVFPNRSFAYSYWATFERTDIHIYNGEHNVTIAMAMWRHGSHDMT
jgi:hypothetical protein